MFYKNESTSVYDVIKGNYCIYPSKV